MASVRVTGTPIAPSPSPVAPRSRPRSRPPGRSTYAGSIGATMSATILLAISLLLVAACGMFVAAEFAFVTVDRNKVDRAVEDGDRAAAGVQMALRSLSTQLSGAQVGITVTNLAIGFLAEPAISQLVDGPLTSLGVPEDWVRPISIGLGLVISTALTVVFGELVPKNFAIAKPMETARATQRFMRSFTTASAIPIRAAQRERERHRPPARHRAAGGAAVGTQLDRARQPHRALGGAGHPRRRHGRAHGTLGGVRHPDGGRDHDAARAHHQPRGDRSRDHGHRDRPQHGALALPGARRRRHGRRHRPREARRRAARLRAVDHPHQAHHGQADRRPRLAPSRTRCSRCCVPTAFRWRSCSTSTAGTPASSR